MPPFGAGDNTVKLGIQIDGLGDAERGLAALQSAIDGLNSSAASGSSLMASSGQSPSAFPGSSLFGQSGVLTPGSPYAMGSTALPAGFGAPPAPGVQSPYSGFPTLPGGAVPTTGGTPGYSGGIGGAAVGGATIQAGTVTIVNQSGSIGGLGGPAGAATAPNPSGGGFGAPPAPGVPGSGAGASPIPGWTPFGGGGAWPGFVQATYAGLEAQTGWQGALGARFLSHNDLGRQAFGSVASLESFLPQGFMQNAAGFFSAAAPWLAGVGLVGGTIAGAMDINNAKTLPTYYQRTREIATDQAGQWYDPIARQSDRLIAQSQGNQGEYEAWRANPIGWIGRIASFGIADAVWSGYIKPGFDRERSLEESRKRRRQTARTLLYSTGIDVTGDAAGRYDDMGDDMPDSLRLLEPRTDLATALGPFGVGQRSTILGFDFSKYSTPAAGISAAATIQQLGMRPGFEDIGAKLLSDSDPRNFMGVFRKQAIFDSDYRAIDAVGEEYIRQFGMSRGLDMKKQDLQAALSMSAARTSGQISQADLGRGMANVSFLQMSGGSYRDVAAMQSSLGTQFDGILSSLETQRAAATNPLDRARLDEQLAQVRNQRYSTTQRDPAMTIFSGRGLVASTSATFAENALGRSIYGNSEGDVLSAYGSQSSAVSQRQRLLRDMSQSPFFSPEQRASYAADAASLQNQLDFGIPRAAGQFSLGLRTGELGIAGARVGVQASNAALYGGIGDVYSASVAQSGITRQQLGLVGRELAGEFGPRTQQERLDLQQKQIDLQRELNQTLEESKRQFASATLGVAQFGQSLISTRGGYEMSFFGVGGGAAAGLQTQNVTAARATLAVAQKNFDATAGLPADNPYRQQRARELQDAQVGAQSAVQATASLPFSVGLEREAMAGEFRLGMLSRTYASYGDIRGTVSGLMGNVAARGRELQDMQRSGLAQIESDGTLSPQEKEQRKSVFMRDIEQRRYGLGNEAIGLQQQLESGWQERLTSSVVGMPERGAFVASQFTRREAAPFLQSMTSVFGFSGPGATASRDYFLHRGDRIANSVVGAIQRPDGFTETAMAMANGGVLRPGTAGASDGSKLTIEVIVRDPNGNPLGRGQSSTTLHDLMNNKSTLGSVHAAGVSRQ